MLGTAAAVPYREITELTLAHVGLGRLTEAAAMDLVGNAHCHRLTHGTGHSIRGIVDETGRVVYPGYYYTKLDVLPGRLLGLHRVWEHVAVEIDVRRYGALLLASRASLAGHPSSEDARAPVESATVLACNSFYIDRPGGQMEAVAPKPGTVAALPPLKEAPWAREVQAVPRLFAEAQARGSIDPAFGGDRCNVAALRLIPRFGYDLPWGEHVAFSQYATICGALERDALASIGQAGSFPTAAWEWSETVRRETVYCAMVSDESALTARVRMRVSPASDRALPSGRRLAAELEFVVDVRREPDDALVLSSSATRVLAVPDALTELVEQCRRWCEAVS